MRNIGVRKCNALPAKQISLLILDVIYWNYGNKATVALSDHVKQLENIT